MSSSATTTDVAAERTRLLTRLLRDAGEMGPDDAVQELTQLEGGWSRFSHIARVRARDGAERKYVVRVKAPFGLFDTDLIAEYNVFVGLQELDLPTPRVFGLHETVDNPFGGELFVMEYLTGNSVNVWRGRDHATLQEDWAGPRGIASDVVTFAARIHSVGPDQAPAGLQTVSFLDSVKRWRGEYEDAGFNRDPILEGAFEWLSRARAGRDAHRTRPRRLPHREHAPGGRPRQRDPRLGARLHGRPALRPGLHGHRLHGRQAPAPQDDPARRRRRARVVPRRSTSGSPGSRWTARPSAPSPSSASPRS